MCIYIYICKYNFGKIFRTKIVHTSGKIGFVFRKVSKHIFKISSYIQKDTQNPNPIFKVTIHCTKYAQNAKLIRQIPQISNFLEQSTFQKCQFFILFLYKFHNSYFVTIVYFIYLGYFEYFGYFGIFWVVGGGWWVVGGG